MNERERLEKFGEALMDLIAEYAIDREQLENACAAIVVTMREDERDERE